MFFVYPKRQGTKRIVSDTVSKIIMKGKAMTNPTTEPKIDRNKGFWTKSPLKGSVKPG